MYGVNQQIIIQPVANGWVVTVPYEVPSPADQQISMFGQMVGEIQKTQQRDPVLQQIMQENTEDAAKPQGKISFKPIPNVFIFLEFEEVLLFLSKKINTAREPQP